MAIVEKVTQDDLILFEILKNPVLCMEFIHNIDLDFQYDEEFKFVEYQSEILCDFNSFVNITTGRATGKCLQKDSMILNPETGDYHSVEEWFNSGELSSIVSINKDWKQKIGKPVVQPNGRQECVEVETVNGYKTTVTENHPILTNSGFKEAVKLCGDDYIAVPDSLPYFGDSNYYNKSEITILSHFIAEGTYHVGSITTTEQETIDDIYKYAEDVNLRVRRDGISYFIVGTPGVKNKYLKLLEDANVRDLHSYDKFVPLRVFTETREHVSLFLKKLFDGDGWCLHGNNREVGYASTSEKLVRDVKHLLLRFGIQSSIVRKENNHRGAYSLGIRGHRNLKKFKKYIGFSVKRKAAFLNSIVDETQETVDTNDVIPFKDFKKYRKPKYDTKSGKYYDSKLQYMPTRNTVEDITNRDVDYKKFVESDIHWVKVKNVSSVGIQETFAVDVGNHGTLVADDIYSHNSVSLVSLITWILVFNVYPQDYILYTVPSKVHLEPVFTGLIRVFKRNSLLKSFLPPSGGINSSDYKISLTNGSVLLCRIAGQSGTGANLIGLHTPFIAVDEGGYYPHVAFQEMQPSVNVWTQGFRELVAGVPTGQREKNVLYMTDRENDSYTKHRVSAHDNPRMTEADIENAIQQYGGTDTDDFIHYVLGQHGKPIFSIFDRTLMKLEKYPVIKLEINGVAAGVTAEEILSKISTFPRINNLSDGEQVFFGIDLGYTEPTAINILRVNRLGNIRFYGRIKLTKVSYPIQEKIINILDSNFNPFLIGIDKGSSGMSLIQHLIEGSDYKMKNFNERVIPIDFSSSIVIGYDTDGKEIKTKTKSFTVSVLQDYSNNHRIVYSTTDPEMIEELERMTFSRSPNGELVYRTLTQRGGKKGEDHFTAGLLCGIGAYYLVSEEITKTHRKPNLFQATWI